MNSPFPGMDPYLERRTRWLGVHNRFLAKAEEAIVASLPPHYATELEERLVIDEYDRSHYRADLSVWADRDALIEGDAGTAVAELTDFAVKPPVKTLDRPPEEWTLTIYGERGELVCTVELLSWSNKTAGRDRERFLKRREELMNGPGSYVEIDLLRGGHAMPEVEMPVSDYRVLVCPAYRRPKVWMDPISVRERLPTIPIPLRPPDKPAPLDLQATWDSVMQIGRYVPRIYETPPEPPLEGDDAACAAERVAGVSSTRG